MISRNMLILVFLWDIGVNCVMNISIFDKNNFGINLSPNLTQKNELFSFHRIIKQCQPLHHVIYEWWWIQLVLQDWVHLLSVNLLICFGTFILPFDMPNIFPVAFSSNEDVFDSAAIRYWLSIDVSLSVSRSTSCSCSPCSVHLFPFLSFNAFLRPSTYFFPALICECHLPCMQKEGYCGPLSRHRPEVRKLGGRFVFPFLWDESMQIGINESSRIVQHLWKYYRCEAKSRVYLLVGRK